MFNWFTIPVWDADWQMLVDLIEDHDWNILQSLDPSEGAAEFTSRLMAFCELAIGRRELKEIKSTLFSQNMA